MGSSKSNTRLVAQSKVGLDKQNDKITQKNNQNYSLWTFGRSHSIILYSVWGLIQKQIKQIILRKHGNCFIRPK